MQVYDPVTSTWANMFLFERRKIIGDGINRPQSHKEKNNQIKSYDALYQLRVGSKKLVNY